MSLDEDRTTDRARRLGLVLWEFEVTFPAHEVENEVHWCLMHPEFAEEIRGYAEAARRHPVPDEDECRADAEVLVGRWFDDRT